MPASRFYSNTAVAGTIGNTGGISNSGTSLFFPTTPSGYPSGTSFPFTLVLEPGTSNMEVVNVTSGAGTSGTPWVIARGFDGTTAVSHAQGVPVVHDFTALDATTSRNHEALGSGSGVHGLPLTAWSTGSFSVIAEDTLANSTTATLTFSSIPATFKHLLIVALGRLTETSAQSDDLVLTINGDTGTNYSSLVIGANTASGTLTAPASVTAFGATNIPLLRLTASSAGAAVNAGGGFAILPWYTSTVFNKVAVSLSGAGNGTSAFIDGRIRWGFYNPTTQAAISSLSISCPPSCNFVVGTSVGLYGLT